MERSDQALRRMVARMPSMAKADFDAIMEDLSDQQSVKVLALLKELEGSHVEDIAANELQPHHTPLIVPDNLSSWLVARVNGNPAAGDEVVEQFSMTQHAISELRVCAAELVPQPETGTKRPSLLDQLFRRFIGHRVAA
ncbi:hypothetical protein [Sphingorhabdus sp.]|uniref:hypothetical protein n=1 Tax=Sphingorhabdus sp. TaxID=1902408 RepID=UPI0025FF7809|nr:hypothetical protein [Sphingorhabdus sp.]